MSFYFSSSGKKKAGAATKTTPIFDAFPRRKRKRMISQIRQFLQHHSISILRSESTMLQAL